MSELVLLKPHTHAGKTCGAGERIEVDETAAQWLLTNGVATLQPKPLKTEPEPKPIHHKDPKP